jgi:ABC-2 type transport system permease protein
MHVFQYRLRCIIRDKETMFWTLLFPLILATFFNLAFSNLTKGEIFDTIPIAIVEQDEYTKNKELKQIVENATEAGDSGENALFEVHVVSLERAKEMLDHEEVSGYVLIGANEQKNVTAEIFVKRNGMNQTIIKEFFDRVIQIHGMIGEILRERADGQTITGDLTHFVSEPVTYFQAEKEDALFPDYTLIYFYSLIGMACFYGAFVGMKEVNAIQADLSAEAIRVNVAPTKKMKMFFSSLAAATVIQFLSLIILLGYLVFVIGVSFGTRIYLLLFLCLVACLCGVSYGTMIALLVKRSEGIKTAILIGTTMTLSFLAGMMQVQVKYAVTEAVPAMAWINPVNVITDALYALYYYPTNQRFFLNLVVLTGFTVLFSIVSIWRLRRLRYASI